MRKIQSIMFALLMFHFSCEPVEDTAPGVDYEQMSLDFEDMFKGSFNIIESVPLISVVDRTSKEFTVRIEMENISKATVGHFQDHFNSSIIQNKRPFYPTSPFSCILSEANMIQTVENVIDTSKVFNDIQKMYIKSLSKDVATLQNYMDGFGIVTSFRSHITNSKELSVTDRIILLEFASGANALLRFIQNGGLMKAQKSLTSILGNNLTIGRTLGCRVDWRDVWSGAVIGLVSSAAYGAYLGATVGTVTVPILGTAVGAVGGAVLSGAAGFTAGAVSGIAASLLTSCFRSGTLQQSYTSCEAAWKAYMNYQTNTFPADCLAIPIIF